MAVIHPRIHWGTREVDWTWVPETTDEITGVARRMAAEAMGVLGFVFFAGAAIIVNSKVSEGSLGVLGMAAATGVAYALMVYMFHPVSGGHLNPAVTLGELAARRMPPSIAALYLAAQAVRPALGAVVLGAVVRALVGGPSSAAGR